MSLLQPPWSRWIVKKCKSEAQISQWPTSTWKISAHLLKYLVCKTGKMIDMIIRASQYSILLPITQFNEWFYWQAFFIEGINQLRIPFRVLFPSFLGLVISNLWVHETSLTTARDPSVLTCVRRACRVSNIREELPCEKATSALLQARYFYIISPHHDKS